MDYFDAPDAMHYPGQSGFDGNSGGGGPDLDDWLRDFEESRQPPVPEWVFDALEDITNQVLQDNEVAQIVDEYQDKVLSESAQRVVENQIRAEVVQNDLDGAYDDWKDKVNDYAESSNAWHEANDFADPYLDWEYELAQDFWRDDTPSWWGDEYGLY